MPLDVFVGFISPVTASAYWGPKFHLKSMSTSATLVSLPFGTISRTDKVAAFYYGAPCLSIKKDVSIMNSSATNSIDLMSVDLSDCMHLTVLNLTGS